MGRDQALEPFFGTPGRDADVERLLESFSFLAGRLREKLDDELPEITHGLFGMLWPNYLRPLPAASVIQYQLHNNATNTSFIPRGTLVESTAVGGTACRFQTVYDTEVLPLAVVDQRMIERHGTAIMAVRFAITGGGLRDLPLSRLRVFFTGEKDESIPYTLYLNLVYRLREVRFVIREAGPAGDLREHVTATLPPSCIRPLGFQEDEGLYPYPKETALGYRMLQEYFCYPEKFLFVEIAGLEQGLNKETLARFADTKEFELHFVLPALPERYETFQAANWRLFCTPVINIFPYSAAPLHVTRECPEYKVVPETRQPEHVPVYSVEHVENWQHLDNKGDSFADLQPINAAQYWSGDSFIRYRLHVRPALDHQNVETFITFDRIPVKGATVGLTLLCTNGLLPAQLGLGDIRENISNDANAVPFKNIVPVSPPHPPPCDADTLWQLLSNMSLNYIPLTDVSAFRAVIATYAFRAGHNRAQAKALDRLLQGIRAIDSPTTDRIFDGLPRRGARTTITMDQTFFSCEGAMYLFGSALNEFLSMYATVNSFHQLIIKEASRGEEYQWPARLGSAVRQ
jgi:type VI secretion system protein ImpG